MGHTGDPWGGLDPNWLPEISPRAAESVAAVGAAITAIASTLGLACRAVVRADEVRDEVPTHDLARLIRDGVNDNETWPEFIETLVSTCLLRGNALASIDTDGRGRLASLTTMPWDAITPRITDAGPVAVRLPAAHAAGGGTVDHLRAPRCAVPQGSQRQRPARRVAAAAGGGRDGLCDPDPEHGASFRPTWRGRAEC